MPPPRIQTRNQPDAVIGGGRPAAASTLALILAFKDDAIELHAMIDQAIAKLFGDDFL